MIELKLTEQEYMVMSQLMQLGLSAMSEKMNLAYAESQSRQNQEQPFKPENE